MRFRSFADALRRGRPILLDGGMGTTMRSLGLTATEAHEAFLSAGAEIITADTVSLASVLVEEADDKTLSETKKRVQTALDARGRYCARYPERNIWVAGSIGPLPAGFEERLPEALATYRLVMEAIVSAGADILLVETATSPEIARMALRAAREVAPDHPAILSAWLPEGYPSALPAQFGRIAREEGAVAAGLNCIPASVSMISALRSLTGESRLPAVFYPSVPADWSPEAFVDFIAKGFEIDPPAIIGGCCGATPAHIAALMDAFS